MAKQTITLHMYEGTGPWNPGSREVFEVDMRDIPSFMEYRVYIGATATEIEWPDIDTRQLQIDALEAEIHKERADSQARVNLLLDRISKLQAITHEVGE